MLQREKEGPVFDVDKKYAALHRRGKCLPDEAETFLPMEPGIDRLCNEMVENRINFFHLLIITSLLAGFYGCGHKKPPYYPKEKSAPKKSAEGTHEAAAAWRTGPAEREGTKRAGA
jgi:predicted small lipoprotein YifL